MIVDSAAGMARRQMIVTHVRRLESGTGGSFSIENQARPHEHSLDQMNIVGLPPPVLAHLTVITIGTVELQQVWLLFTGDGANAYIARQG